ncbi:vegetative protein [Hyalangium rubrum]|uniref:Vegetative protein n=1 Tax=Hyalangium rubrum TaxID=3103134 RepID=A0ABU5H5N0_9BACT|nr:vegetative protein [Hyalangium sp. s54d21]MDY7228782.1 vegetative protein [Hyalangium sp. s54d21]
MAEEAKKTNPHKSWPRTAKGNGKKACTVANCKRPYRAKGYCFFHYKKWRQEELPHSRYKTCSKPECRAKAGKAGLCEKHYGEAYKKEAAA